MRVPSVLLALLLYGGMLPASAAETPAGGPSAMLATARELRDTGRFSDAARIYRELVNGFPDAPQAAPAQFELARLLEQADQPDRAFNLYKDFIQRHPESELFDDAIAAQFSIANEYLEGRRVRFLGLPLGSGYARAAEMYQSILEVAPFSRFAPMAQFNLGLAYEKKGRAQEAVAAYQRVLDRYPNSGVADDALYQIAYVYMRIGFAGGSQDLSSLVLAKNTFEDFLFQFPNSEKVPQAQENLELIGERESDDLMGIARFYDRSRDYRAAVIYYNDIIRRMPNSEQAELAKVRVEELRSDVGDDVLRAGPERTETGETIALRRRLQAQVETSALTDYAGPPRRDVVREELPVVRPRLRTEVREVAPLPPVEPPLPME